MKKITLLFLLFCSVSFGQKIGANQIKLGTGLGSDASNNVIATGVGTTGATGATGSNGSNGSNGATGITGATGATGSTGANGSNGAVGATGSTGAVGATGSTGTAGTNGTNGTNGSNGATGATGSNGTNGTNGATGTAGANGTNGATGATGVTGATGTGIAYTVYGNASIFSPADATTYYFGSQFSVATGTTANIKRIYIPTTGTITKVYVTINVAGTLATSETSTYSIRLNNTTDTQISAAVTMTATTQTFSNTGLSIAVTAGDYIEIKLVTATWVTNPTNVSQTAVIYIE